MGKIKKDSRRIALFMAIGSGVIEENSCFLYIKHKKEQKEYLEWKRDLLKKSRFFCSNIYSLSDENNDEDVFFVQNKCLKLIKKILYKNNKKVLSDTIFKKITPLGLAIWYMDVGSITTTLEKSILTIPTYLDKEENQKIINVIFERFHVKFYQKKIKKNYALSCGTKEARKFLNIVKDYIEPIKCMNYKLNIKPIECKQNNN